jgi:hypothetical protein
MLSAHFVQSEESELRQMYLKIETSQSFDSAIAWQILIAFTLGLCNFKVFKDSMNQIRHKKELELTKKSIIIILENGFNGIENLFVALDGIKDSVLLALGNQICYFLKNQNHWIEACDSEEIIIRVLKKMIMLNYLVTRENQENQNCEFRDIWNVIAVLEKLSSTSDICEIPQLAKFIDLERDFIAFKNGSFDCFCRHTQMLTLENKRQLLQIESKSMMRQELQVIKG